MSRLPTTALLISAMALADLPPQHREKAPPPKRTNPKRAAQAPQKKARAINRRNRT
jgi:hypothetical protein